jgi:hypothetical protein
MTTTAQRTSAFEKVARLIAGDPAPAWLVSMFEWLAQGVTADIIHENRRPTRRQLRKKLTEARDAAQLLSEFCRSSIGRGYLDSLKFGPSASGSRSYLILLSEQMSAAIRLLQDASGQTSRGANRAHPPGTFTPKVLVAARVSETWRYFHGKDPGTRNHLAASAAETLWVASGGQKSIACDIEEGWRLQFKALRAHRKHLERLRNAWREDLDRAKQQGRAPIFLKHMKARG